MPVRAKTLLFLASASLFACGGENRAAARRDLDRMQEQVRQLQLEAGRNETRIRALERQMDLLARRQAVEPAKLPPAAEPSSPRIPVDLEVVRLAPAAEREEEGDSFAFIALAPDASPSSGRPGADGAPALPTRVDLKSVLPDDDGYERGLRALEAGRAEEGIETLERFLAANPTDPRADNALLALGEAWLVRQMPGRALSAFQRVVTEYPAGDAVSEALLRYGETCISLGRIPAARAAFARLVDQFPDSPATARARGRLPDLEEGEIR